MDDDDARMMITHRLFEVEQELDKLREVIGDGKSINLDEESWIPGVREAARLEWTRLRRRLRANKARLQKMLLKPISSRIRVVGLKPGFLKPREREAVKMQEQFDKIRNRIDSLGRR